VVRVEESFTRQTIWYERGSYSWN